MNIPEFTAGACLYRSSNHYQMKSTGIAGQGTIEAALRRRGDPTCSGPCPKDQMMCTCSKACKCCPLHLSCACDVNGEVFCSRRGV